MSYWNELPPLPEDYREHEERESNPVGELLMLKNERLGRSPTVMSSAVRAAGPQPAQVVQAAQAAQVAAPTPPADPAQEEAREAARLGFAELQAELKADRIVRVRARRQMVNFVRCGGGVIWAGDEALIGATPDVVLEARELVSKLIF
jgi:hypothetical protein